MQKFMNHPHRSYVGLQVFNWAVLEPENGVFDWYWLDKNLTAWRCQGSSESNYIHTQGAEDKLGTTQIVYFAWYPVPTHRKQNVFVAPNYLDPVFQKIFSRLIYDLHHLNELPEYVKDNIWEVQATLGITGDSRPWKGSQ